jgi:hypothetical protein
MKIGQPSNTIKKNLPFLKLLFKNKKIPRVCHAIISRASPSHLLALVEIALNLLKKRVPITKSDRAILAIHAETIRQLSRAKTPKSAKRILLSPRKFSRQQGAGIPIVIAGLLASTIAPILADIITKQIDKI